MVARSRTGCLTCRHRKLKCDEQRPKCGQCQKAHRECQPSSGIVFRHQQNASMNDPDAQEGDSLQGFYAYKNTFTRDSVWVDIPSHVTFVVNADPEADFSLDEARMWAGEQVIVPVSSRPSSNNTWKSPPAPDPDFSLVRPPGLEALSAAASGDPYLSSRTPRTVSRDTGHHSEQNGDGLRNLNTPSTHRSASAFSPPSNNFFSQVLNPVPQSSLSPPVDPSLSHVPSGFRSPQETEVETDHEMAFLLRHFTEEPAPWMDLFDIYRYFTNYVPVKAMTNPILKSATCAYAARQLSLVGGKRPTMGGSASTSAPSELFPNITTTDWGYKCTQYYDRAIQLLMQGIREGMVGVGRNSPEEERQAMDSPSASFYGSPGHKRRFDRDRSLSDSQIPPYQWKKRRKVSHGRYLSDEMTAATAILCDYEQMQEGSGNAWNRHLDGTKSLLDIVAGSMMPLQPSHASTRPLISRARKATFWNFARQDFLSGLINKMQTRLDPDNIPMWKDAGLLFDDEGFIKPSNLSPNGLPEGPEVMTEDMISNALIWVMDKIVNYAVAADTGPKEGRAPWEGINQEALYEKWFELSQHLAAWYSGLPDTFRPCAQLQPRALPESIGRGASIFPEIWYNNPMCASTMQSYHMARMLLILNMPQQSTMGKTTYYKRFSSYKEITQEAEAHAISICGIAVSRPEGAVRIHSVQPLFTAGQSLTGTLERRGVIKLLREIERDTGWATGYRVRKLCEEWGWPAAEGPAYETGISHGISP